MAGINGEIPYRMALAGGWIDQPFVSRHNPDEFGSMVVVSLEPDFMFMDRCGMATSSRKAADRLWNGRLPDAEPADLVKALYEAENCGTSQPSGSQDMIGIIYPGISRLDYSPDYADGLYPLNIISETDPSVAEWLQNRIHILPVAQRPAGYNPLETKNLDPEWIRRLGQTGKDCFNAIMQRDTDALGRSMNDCMLCWENILPGTVKHGTITADLKSILKSYQNRYPGAMYSGCGGGYLYVVSEEPVPGSFLGRIRTGRNAACRA